MHPETKEWSEEKKKLFVEQAKFKLKQMQQSLVRTFVPSSLLQLATYKLGFTLVKHHKALTFGEAVVDLSAALLVAPACLLIHKSGPWFSTPWPSLVLHMFCVHFACFVQVWFFLHTFSSSLALLAHVLCKFCHIAQVWCFLHTFCATLALSAQVLHKFRTFCTSLELCAHYLHEIRTFYISWYILHKFCSNFTLFAPAGHFVCLFHSRFDASACVLHKFRTFCASLMHSAPVLRTFGDSSACFPQILCFAQFCHFLHVLLSKFCMFYTSVALSAHVLHQFRMFCTSLVPSAHVLHKFHVLHKYGAFCACFEQISCVLCKFRTFAHVLC